MRNEISQTAEQQRNAEIPIISRFIEVFPLSFHSKNIELAIPTKIRDLE